MESADTVGGQGETQQSNHISLILIFSMRKEISSRGAEQFSYLVWAPNGPLGLKKRERALSNCETKTIKIKSTQEHEEGRVAPCGRLAPGEVQIAAISVT